MEKKKNKKSLDLQHEKRYVAKFSRSNGSVHRSGRFCQFTEVTMLPGLICCQSFGFPEAVFLVFDVSSEVLSSCFYFFLQKGSQLEFLQQAVRENFIH